MVDREALKLALDAIETYSPDYMHGLPKKYYIKAIQKALAQPEQEWVGLTEAERVDIIDIEIDAPETEHFALAQSIEAALKEKNK